MWLIGERAFASKHGPSLDEHLQRWIATLELRMSRMNAMDLDGISDRAAAEDLVQRHAIQPLEVDIGAARDGCIPVRVSAHNRFDYDMEPGDPPVPGFRVTRAFSFKGDPALWEMKPALIVTHLVRGTVKGRNFIVGADVPEEVVDEAHAHIRRCTDDLPDCLVRQADQIRSCRDEAVERLTGLIARHRAG
ncbi:hypothetical protein ACFOGJ_18070 [Marinibaculum pumilum]|uniref:Uncharacterized protein n=1 Tax=Marinibaculum pumilum TaxID=1766165 RepID=A0ABV7L3G1_9PROT